MILKIEKKRKAKQNATLNNRLKNTQNKIVIPIISQLTYSKSLLFLVLSGMLLFKQENAQYSNYL